MESLRNIKTYIKTKLSSLFNSNRVLAIKKEYLYSFFKKEDLRSCSTDGFDFFIIPSEYYLWKGVNIASKKNQNLNIKSKNTEEILEHLSSYFFADKETASLYGTKRYISKNVGFDLQFRIVKDIVLLDISSVSTIIALYNYIKNITIDELEKNKYLIDNYTAELEFWKGSDKWKINYPTEEIFFTEKWKKEMKGLIIDTLGNYDRGNSFEDSIGSPKTPTMVERKSKEFFDSELVKLICGMKHLNCNGQQINGWIYFKQIKTDDNISTFHDELMICNPYGHIEYVGYHKI